MNTIKKADIMFVIGVFLLVGAHFITNMTVWTLVELRAVGAGAEAVARSYEANPFAIGLLTSVNGFKYIISYVLYPAFLLTMYYLMRKQYIKTKPIYLLFTSAFILFFGTINFLNDLSNLI